MSEQPFSLLQTHKELFYATNVLIDFVTDTLDFLRDYNTTYLTSLNCSKNSLHVIKSTEIPIHLEFLNLNDNPLLQSVWLPIHLKTLLCSNTGLVNLPLLLPPQLKKLDCSKSLIRTLPELPNCLEELNVSFCISLAQLPVLPRNLKVLQICGCNKIDAFQIPPKLVHLECSFIRNLKQLEELPTTLTRLNCMSTGITTLDCSNLVNLQELKCGYNDLCSLSFPPTLQSLSCIGIRIKELQFPSSLKYLDCTGVPITHLDTLPRSLVYLNCSHTGISSLEGLPEQLQEIVCQSCPCLKTIEGLPAHVKINYEYNPQLCVYLQRTSKDTNRRTKTTVNNVLFECLQL